jgi:HK97 family phage prohead protease
MPETFLRAFPAGLTLNDHHGITGRLVPYGTPTDVLDMVDGKPDIYREGFRRGAFAAQASSGEKGVFRRIGFIHKHDGGLGYLGSFSALREEDDGLYGDVDLLRSKAGDVEDLLSAGVDELSVEFRLTGRANTDVVNGVRWRTKAHLDAVALEPKGAYSGARVLAFREEMDAVERERAEQLSEEEATRKQIAADVERVAAEAAARRAQWDELTARLDAEKTRQDEYVRNFGITDLPHGGLPIRSY